jgi:polyhydroxyalkanoate synthesis repressor PhaR
MLLVKKYPNRRLYDTRHSRYITLDDLEKTIRAGEDVTVQDAQDGRDLTQETLTQIVLDRGGGRILPATLLLRLIRLDDAALGEFLTRYVSWALDMYVQAKDRARALLPLNPLATAPFAATDALARLVLGAAQWSRGPGDLASHLQGMPPLPVEQAPPPVDVTSPAFSGSPSTTAQSPVSDTMPIAEAVAVHAPRSSSPSDVADEMLRLRREIEALKESMGGATSAPSSRAKVKKKAKRPAKRV